MAKHCAYCGRENAEAASHCHECGTQEFKAAVVSPGSTPPRPRPLTDLEFAQLVFRKALAAFCLIMLALVVCGCYGALHNQISYTIAPEYFTRLKFAQFRTDPNLPECVRAAIVGYKAASWMGFPVGIAIVTAGLLQRGWWRMVRETLYAYGFAAAVTLGAGMLGLLVGLFSAAAGVVHVPAIVVSKQAFVCVGWMHNFSYLGGCIGIIAGIGWQVSRWRKLRAIEAAGSSPG